MYEAEIYANIHIQKMGRFTKLHATLRTQNLPEIGRLPYLGVEIDKNVSENL